MSDHLRHRAKKQLPDDQAAVPSPPAMQTSRHKKLQVVTLLCMLGLLGFLVLLRLSSLADQTGTAMYFFKFSDPVRAKFDHLVAQRTQSRLLVQTLKSTSLTSQDIMKCPDSYPSPSKRIKQKCCQLLGEAEGVSCLPSLVVLGAQKSATTILHSYMLLHPQIAPIRRKETHLFDVDRNFGILPLKLATLLIPQENRDSVISDHVFFESTPSYIADYKTCSRIKSYLSNDAKFIMIMKNPVDRLWSEIQMKHRRVQLQDDFLQNVLPAYREEFVTCWNRLCKDPHYSNCVLPLFRACLPHALARNGRIGSFFNWVVTMERIGLEFMINCFPWLPASECIHDPKYRVNAPLEVMPPMPDQLLDELNLLRNLVDNEKCCMLDIDQQETRSKPPLQRQAGSRDLLQEASPSSDSLHECVGCGCHCFPRSKHMSDVSKLHAWRSMYYLQLKHCFESLDISRFMFIDSEELRNKPTQVLNTMFEWAGLESNLNFDNYSSEDLSTVFGKFFPDFETKTGWSHQGMEFTDLEMDPNVRRQLQDFFRPQNRLLFDLIQVPPYQGWDV